MAVKMRLRREGKKKQPFYRVVVADVRSPRDGRFIEDLGFYHPTRDPSEISIDRERALHWLRNGVTPSNAVLNLLRIEGIWEEFKPGDPGKERSQRNRAQAAARAEAKGQGQAAVQPQSTETATDPREEAPDDVVEQAVEEDTQPVPGPAEETGALEGDGAGAAETTGEEDTSS